VKRTCKCGARCLVTLLFILVGGAAAWAQTPVRLALDWSTWVAYHAPLLIAQEKGYFKAENLDVTMTFTRGSKDGVIAVGTGQGDVGWEDLSSAMYGMLAKVPVKGVAQIQHKNATGLIVAADSTIYKPGDLKGHTIGSTPGGSDSTVLTAFLAANGLKPSDMTIVNVPADAKLAAFLTGKVDVISGQGWYYGAATTSQGKPSRVVLYADFGINLLDHGFIASDDYIKAQKPMITALLRAYQKALDDTIAHPDQACAVVVKNVPLNSLSQDLCMKQITAWLALLDSNASKNNRWGWNDPAVWQNTYDFLQKYDKVETVNSVESLYTDAMLP
jgi:NitT/TauT family transport system substrate-binding protein